MIKTTLLAPLLILVSGVVCLEMAIPVAVGEFLAGILGRLILGDVQIAWLPFLSQLGVLSLMFLAGLEVDIPTLKRNLAKSLIIGISSYLGPFLLVFAISYGQLELGLKASVLLSTSLSTTSMAIIFPFLREKSLLNLEEGQILLASAMVVDILSMITLACLMGIFTVTNTLITGVLLVGILILKKTMIVFLNRYKGNRSEIELKFLLLILLALEIFATEIGLHAALICFIFGMVFSDIDPQHEVIIDKLSSVVFSLLAPAFFFHVGTLVDISQINWRILGLFSVLLAVSFSGKWLGTYLFLRSFCPQIAVYGSHIFNFRLSFGLICALYGIEAKIISVEYFQVISLCILGSGLLATFFEGRSRLITP